jgi:predicted AAA+ superfamily ATPase
MTLLPFSWAEVKTISEESFLNYLQEGGFPDLVMKNASTQSYLTQLYDSILMRDIVQRYKVRNIFALRSLCDLLIRSVGSHVTGRSLQKSLPVELNNSTIENYIRYLEEAFLVVLLQKFEPSLAKQKKADRKPYVYDTGFIRAINPSQITDNLGQLLETYVFLTLIRLGAAPNVDLFYYQNPKSEEVDFIWFKKGKKPILIQSCWTLAESSTRQREFRALLSASKKFKTDELLIVSINERKSYKEENQTIKVIKAENLETEFS